MKLTWDEGKRQRTLRERGLDFADCADVFIGEVMDVVDDRTDYGEARFVTYGWLEGRMVAVVWTPRESGRRIISMRKTNEREQADFRNALDRP